MRNFLFFALPLSSLAAAQNNWMDAGIPGNTIGIQRLWLDPNDERMYAIGYVNMDEQPNNFGNKVIPYYQSDGWSVLSSFHGVLLDVTSYGDTLLVGGTLYAVSYQGDSTPVSSVAAFYDGAWHPYGEFSGAVRRLKVLDGELFAVGAFQLVDGQSCNSVAKRVGGQWVPVGQLEVEPPTSTPNLTDMIKYQGDLYACGVINLAPNGENGIVRFDGQSWSAPGGGILGGVAAGRCMAVYQDELYLGGSFYLNAGNAGHMIQRWNGMEWRSVGGHLRDGVNSTDGAARCYALFEYQGKLLAAGGFQYAAGVPAQTFAIWDGERWCGTGDAISNESHSIALYQDTIYLASGRWVNGDSTNCVVKWVSGALNGVVCSKPLSVQSEALATEVFTLHPNPTTGLLQIQHHGLRPRELFARDALGREVLRQGVPHANTGPLTLDLAPLSPGAYLVTVVDEQGMRFTQRVVRE